MNFRTFKENVQSVYDADMYSMATMAYNYLKRNFFHIVRAQAARADESDIHLKFNDVYQYVTRVVEKSEKDSDTYIRQELPLQDIASQVMVFIAAILTGKKELYRNFKNPMYEKSESLEATDFYTVLHQQDENLVVKMSAGKPTGLYYPGIKN